MKLPATPWGDAAFHFANAARSLEQARDQAAGGHEHDVAERMRKAADAGRRRALAIATTAARSTPRIRSVA